MSISTLVQLVDNHLVKFSEKIPVEVRESVTELGYRENGAKGMFLSGKNYLLRDRLINLADARDTLFHELFHLGLRRILMRSQYIITTSELYREAPRVPALFSRSDR